MARLGSGNLFRDVKAKKAVPAASPEIRKTEIPARPLAVANAKIVSFIIIRKGWPDALILGQVSSIPFDPAPWRNAP